VRSYAGGRKVIFDLVCSPGLLEELHRALGYRKLRDRISLDDATGLIDLLTRGAIMASDPDRAPSVRSPDPDDDYLIALAETTRSVLVTGDKDLLGLAGSIPVYPPAGFLDLLPAR
jgi:predicted nucleic acid-binding protein